MRLLLRMLIIFFMTTTAVAAQSVGKVMFVSGDVHVQQPDGNTQVVTVDQDIQAGQQFVTGEGGYLHLRMIDDAYYSVRPNSRFRIETYHYDATQPSNNQIRTQLEAGSVRAITGKAGEANKQGYRLNTPVAAIGVRGTDYIVYHADDATRVAVSSGAVVVSPFNDSCTRASVGACSGSSALLLAANTTGDYLEVRRDQPMPERKQQGWSPQAANTAAPTSAKNTSDNSATQSTTDNRTLVSNVLGDKLETKATVEPSVFRWGRWQDPAVIALLEQPAWQFKGGNVGYLLMQQTDSALTAYPNISQANFALSNAAAGFRTNDGQWQTASVQTGQLGLNFAQGTFNTNLTGVRGDEQTAWQLQAQGAVSPNGTLTANPYKSDAATWVNGNVNNNISQAAYVFDKRYDDGALVGVTEWRVKH